VSCSTRLARYNDTSILEKSVPFAAFTKTFSFYDVIFCPAPPMARGCQWNE